MRKFLGSLALSLAAFTGVAGAEGETAKPVSPEEAWHFSGLTGQHEIAQVQRGFQVFWARCAACHGLEFRRFWHLEHLGYAESEVKSLLIESLAAQGLTYDPSTYSIQNFPASRVSGAPDLTHAVLANGKTMEAGGNYIYSLLLGYDRLNDALLGPAVQFELNDSDEAYVQVGDRVTVLDEVGNLQSVTRRFERNNFYLYGEGEDWVLRNFVDVRTDLQEFDSGGFLLPLESSFSHRLEETDLVHEQAYGDDNPDYAVPQDAAAAWAARDKAHFHEIASWAAGQFYNPFKSGRPNMI